MPHYTHVKSATVSPAPANVAILEVSVLDDGTIFHQIHRVIAFEAAVVNNYERNGASWRGGPTDEWLLDNGWQFVDQKIRVRPLLRDPDVCDLVTPDDLFANNEGPATDFLLISDLTPSEVSAAVTAMVVQIRKHLDIAESYPAFKVNKNGS